MLEYQTVDYMKCQTKCQKRDGSLKCNKLKILQFFKKEFKVSLI